MSRRLASLAIGLFVCALGAPVCRADDASAEAEEALKTRGLRRSATTYVLPAEAEVQKKLTEAKTLYQRLTLTQVRQRELEQGTSNTKLMVQQMTQQRVLLNQQLAQVTNALENNRLVGMLNQLGDQINLMNEQLADPTLRKQLSAQLPAQRAAYLQAMLDLRQLIDKTNAAYEELAGDPEVTSALDALNQKAKAKVTLGPSRSFQANVKLFAKVEGLILSESIEARKEGGIYWIDVTFNGKVTKPLAFDTGSSSVVLSTDLAAELGLKPGKDDPTVQAHIADGSVVEVKQMTIPSVRVGKFTVKNVVCVIMPADKKDVLPLLGQSFLENFTHKFDGETSTLFLSQVETPEADKAAPQAKPSTRPARTKK